MKIVKSDLHATAVSQKQYPKDDLPEIAFVGRSNVGKSSFINSMINRKNLARTSSKPGKTRTINFYTINDEFRFVDLPGYGYANVSETEQKKWSHMIEEYLYKRKNIREIILIVDIRHEPTNQDLMMYSWLKAFGYKGIVVATKSDKISKGNRLKHLNIIRKKLNIKDDSLLVCYSSTNMLNKEKMWEIFEESLK